MDVLGDVGFERLPKPLVVAGARFDFDAAAKGTGALHDLVVVASSATGPPRRLVRLLSGLSRTLDQVESRRPVSVILLGEPPDPSTISDMESYARILTVDSTNPAPVEVRRAIAVLIPLELPTATSRSRDPLSEVAENIGSSLSSEHQQFIDAARIGPDKVQDILRRFIDGAATGSGSEGSES